MAEAYPNYYAILGVAPDADRPAIRESFRRAMHAARKHPDLGGDHAEAALLGEAYAVLRDPQRRLAYDRLYLQHCTTAAAAAPTPATVPVAGAERRVMPRMRYHGMLLLPSEGHSGLTGQCCDLSRDGCSFRTLRPLRTGDELPIIFQDDPGFRLIGRIRWARMLPQRFGPSLYEGGVRFHGADADRFTQFLQRIS